MKWLFTPTLKTRDKIFNIFAAFGLQLVWCILIRLFLNKLYGQDIFQWFMPIQEPSKYFIFFSYCIFPPLFEELLFRHVPIRFAKAAGEKYIIPTIIFTSAIFGLVHGNGMYSVLIQGVGGFVLSCLYIKNNYSYWSTVTAHSLWNISVIYLINFL